MPRTPKTDRRRGRLRDAPPVLVRLDADERARLERTAAEAGTSLSALMRDSVGRLTIISSDEARRVAYLISNLCNNINQLSRVANTFGAASAAEVRTGLATILSGAETLAGDVLPPKRDWTI